MIFRIGQDSSLWPLLYGTSCCFIEFASLIGSRFDFDRYGLVPRSSPRQADLILTAGTVTMKMAPSLVRLYESKCLNQNTSLLWEPVRLSKCRVLKLTSIKANCSALEQPLSRVEACRGASRETVEQLERKDSLRWGRL
uniref:NADH:ubiquinone oxidoreductase-like 20kDa subunit domain-containing protein n=1 Tax=Aegilops tauschii subsp. strangulata TaxID=200361 RepID=A0A453NRK9_AEGTS